MANEDAAGLPGRRMQTMLSQQTREWVCRHGHHVLTTSIAGETCSPADPTSLRLNPRFVEWLMGFPPGWTSVAPNE